MQENQAELIESILDGDDERFAEVVELFDARLRSLVRASGIDSQSVDEIVNDSFALAYQNLGQLKNTEKLEEWLAQITRRRLAKHFRTVSRIRSVESSQEHIAQQPDSRENQLVWIWDEVSQLNRLHREILHLRYRRKFSYSELAEMLKVPVTTIRGRIYEARRALKQRLKEKKIGPWS